jgi:hypothetical protein
MIARPNIIVSIPHMGTRFLSARLGIEDKTHTQSNWEQLVEKTAGKNIIAPLRHPMAALRSAVRRTPPELAFDVVGWVHCFYMMHCLTLQRYVDFIEIEAQADPRITDWSPVGHNDVDSMFVGGRPMYDDRELPALDLGKIFELPFVEQHYG